MRYSDRLAGVLICLMLLASVTQASVFRATDGSVISRGETIDDDLYIFGNFAEISGQVAGDVSSFAYDFATNGTIDGNVNAFAYTAEVRGIVERSVRIFANTSTIGGTIKRDILLISNQINVRKAADIGRDAVCIGAKVNFAGTARSDATIRGETVIITGVIEGDADVKASNLKIFAPAIIKGNLQYESENEALIDDNVTIEGEITWTIPEKEEEGGGISPFTLLFRIALFLLSLTTGLVMILLFKDHTRESAAQINTRPGVTFAIGFVVLATCTIGALIALLLIIGIPIAIFLLTLGMILFYVGKIYVSISLGHLFAKILGGRRFPIALELIVGLIILSLLFMIPFLGSIIYLLTVLMGMGAAVAGYLAINQQRKAALQAAQSPSKTSAT